MPLSATATSTPTTPRVDEINPIVTLDTSLVPSPAYIPFNPVDDASVRSSGTSSTGNALMLAALAFVAYQAFKK